MTARIWDGKRIQNIKFIDGRISLENFQHQIRAVKMRRAVLIDKIADAPDWQTGGAYQNYKKYRIKFVSV